MSDRMTPLSFEELVNWIYEEYRTSGSVFGVRDFFKADPEHKLSIFEEKIETPFGPAAGPHTQLAENIIASYLGGSRFFELKTVQKLDGEDLPVSKPCILAEDEGYNVEWSTELYVPEAFEEYVKAWFILKILSVELNLGSPDGFVFNMSVGYDLEGIKSRKIDDFIEGLKDASGTRIFRECKDYLKKHINLFKNITEDYIDSISPKVCTSITLSTLHGCPAGEIEKIASYLITEKELNTFIKCNPTLLGYDFARGTLNEMGYDYVSFTDFHFKDDLQYSDAVPMLKRLQALADEKGLAFGVKITNTFPVEIKCSELPGEEMYMSGRSLYPLSISLADKLTKDFDGKLRISYSGGADIHNIESIVSSGIWPVTIATTVLKPGGYNRMKQIAGVFAAMKYEEFKGVSPEKTDALANKARKDPYHIKPTKLKENRKIKKDIPLTDCFMAPCQEGCPIHQDISAYMELNEQGRFADALKLIMTKNPLPFMTGTICAHKCMNACTRNFYETSVQIRSAKLLAAGKGYDQVINELKAKSIPEDSRKNIAIIGGGPAGISAAYFLAKEGHNVAIYTASDNLGGVVRDVIPSFRIPVENIEKDVSFIKKLGVIIHTDKKINNIDQLSENGIKPDAIIVAAGAPQAGMLRLDGDNPINAITFLKDYKNNSGKVDIGANVVIIGGGNTAMDTARAALKTEGVKKVYLCYRRSRRYMPADEEELDAAIGEGVEFLELMAPESFKKGILRCEIMRLGEPDESGRRSPVGTGEYREIPADTVIAAVGEKVDTNLYKNFGLQVNEKGYAVLNDSLEGSVPGIYVVGDAKGGPATIVEAIRDARVASDAILKDLSKDCSVDAVSPSVSADSLYIKKGYLSEPYMENDYGRCLNCGVLCENCLDVCPNRANVEIRVPLMDMPQIIHVDRLCNECGNCKSFCPYNGAPYLDKLTLFDSYGDYKNSKNNGFCFTNREGGEVLLRLYDKEYETSSIIKLKDMGVDEPVIKLIEAVYRDYKYLFA